MAYLGDILERMIEEHAMLLHRVAEMERRQDNQVRHGKVTDIDAEKQLARIEIGERDGTPLKSAWVPYAQVAGGYKAHTPPTVGQQMTLFAPNGEVRQAVLLPFTWSNDNQSPSDKADEHVDTFGDKWKWTRKKDLFHIQLDKAEVEIKPASVALKHEGASLTVSANNVEAKVGQASITIEGGAINIDAPKTFIVKKVFLGVDSKNEEIDIKAMTESGPAKQTFAKPE
jgi:phage baseplate assembly protein V